MSMLLGNVFLYFYLGDSATVSDRQRTVIYSVLGIFCVLGTFAFLLLKKPEVSFYVFTLQLLAGRSIMVISKVWWQTGQRLEI